MDLHHIGDHVAAGQRIIDTVMALCHAVADIRCEIARGPAACGCHTCSRCIHKFQQMRASRMAVSKGALDNDLRFF